MPHTAAPCRFGSSVGGFPLLALELSTKPGMDEPKPQVKYVGNIHGDEPSGRSVGHLGEVAVEQPM